MIISQRHQNSIIGQIEKSPFEFYLTGSRFFGGFGPASDWDYFVTDSSEVRNFLFSIGFHENEEEGIHESYDDSTIVTILRQNDIHIQLVRDAKLKARIQLFIRDIYAMKSVSKEVRKQIWKFAIVAYQKFYILSR